MAIGSIFAAIAILLLVAVYIARPFIKPQASENDVPTPYDDLAAQKEALLEQIRTIEFDHDTGKLPDEVFNAQRADLVQQAAAVLKQMDEYDSAEADSSSGNLDEQIEAAVARRRKIKPPA